MKVLFKYLNKNLDYVIILISCLIIFTYLVLLVPTDITVHIRQIVKINSSEIAYPSNFLFYFLVNLFSFFSNNITFMYGVGVILLSSATLGKYAISKHIIYDLNSKATFSKKNIYLIAIGLFFCFAIPDPYSVFILKKMYLGRIVPMVWHNSTTIFLFPFSILLFWKQLRVLESSYKVSQKEMFVIHVLVVINIMIKPSFIFTYIPVTFFLLLGRIRANGFRNFLFTISPIFTGFIYILIQYYLIFILQKGSFQSETSSVVVSNPFEAFSLFIPIWWIPITFFLSLALPLFSLFYFKEIFKFTPFKYSLLLTLTGIVISAFIMETGPRMGDGNFLWQNTICSFLLMLSTVSFLTPKFILKEIKSKRVRCLLLLFFLHSLSGILYLIKIAATLNYY